MKSALIWTIVFVVLLAIVPGISAYTVSGVTVNPSGDVTPGTPVTVSFIIQLTGSGGETFPTDDTLQLYSELDKPRWNYVIVKNDIDEPQPSENGNYLEIYGWVLSYDSDEYEMNIRVILEGSAPSVTTTTNKTLVRVQELDSRNNVVSGSLVTISRQVINIAEVMQLITTRETELQLFRTHIDEMTVLEVDTAAAEAKYSAARTAINDAKSKPSSQYAAAQVSLTNANTLIVEGEKLLNKASAEKDVADAQSTISNVDAAISFIKPNISSTDPRLAPIISKREVAAGFVSTANDEIFAGNYDRASEKAQEAFSKANESYNDALDLKKQITEGFNPVGAAGKLFGSGTVILILVVVAVVLVAAGVIIYRKRSRWDELG
jgi:hypothetical protein